MPKPSRALKPCFTKIRLRSWKSFKQAEVELARRTFIIGANATGKSNFLEVFRFLHDLTTPGGGLEKAVSLREGMTKLRSLHTTGIRSNLEIHAEMEDERGTSWKYTLELKPVSRGDAKASIVKEIVHRGEEAILTRPDAADRDDPKRLEQTAIEQVSANKEFRWIAEFFRSIRYMNLIPALIREGQPTTGQSPGRDPLGRDLLEYVRSLPKGERSRRLKTINAVLKRVVPQFSRLALVEDQKGRPHLEVQFQHWRRNAAKQRESQFSDGTLRLIAILLELLEEGGGPLLLEEPEWSLHAGIIDRLAGFIAKCQAQTGERQTLITTHSDRLLTDPGIYPEEVLLILPAERGGSEIVRGVKHKQVLRAMQNGLTAAEAAVPLTFHSQMNLFENAV